MVSSDTSSGGPRPSGGGSISTVTFSVPGISCEHCRSAIESSVVGVQGVASVDVDIDARSVVVRGGTQDEIVAAIRAAGYETD